MWFAIMNDTMKLRVSVICNWTQVDDAFIPYHIIYSYIKIDRNVLSFSSFYPHMIALSHRLQLLPSIKNKLKTMIRNRLIMFAVNDSKYISIHTANWIRIFTGCIILCSDPLYVFVWYIMYITEKQSLNKYHQQKIWI